MEFDTNLKISGNRLVLDVTCIREPEIKFNVKFLNNLFKGVESMSIKAGQKVNVSIDPRDGYGNKARLDGTPVWDVSDASLASLEVAPDGNSVVVSSTGVVGSFDVQVAADADLSEGIRNLSGSITIDVEAGEAVDLGVHADPIVIAITPTPVDETVTPVEVAPATETETPVDTTAAPADTSAPADTTATDTGAVPADQTGDTSVPPVDPTTEQF